MCRGKIELFKLRVKSFSLQSVCVYHSVPESITKTDGHHFVLNVFQLNHGFWCEFVYKVGIMCFVVGTHLFIALGFAIYDF